MADTHLERYAKILCTPLLCCVTTTLFAKARPTMRLILRPSTVQYHIRSGMHTRSSHSLVDEGPLNHNCLAGEDVEMTTVHFLPLDKNRSPDLQTTA